MSSKKKKKVMTATAALLVLALGVAGTYAWSSSDDSDGNINGTVDVGVKLHDDYDDSQTGAVRDRDIYVENTGESALYIRVRLDEYLELGGRELISGSDKDDKKTWKPHVMDGADATHCGAGFHDYFKWKMGNDTPINYAGGIKNWYKEGKPAQDKQSGTATIVTMKAYTEAPDNAKPTDCWIIDEKDGYAYWSTQLAKETATGLLLNKIEVSTDLDETYLYKVNAKMEAVTEIDLTSWLNDAETTDGKKMNRASENAAKFLKDISPGYVKITPGMNLTTPKASEFDKDRDGYLTKAENKEYGKATGTVKITEAIFTDTAFRDYVKTNLDTDGNGTLTQDELQAATAIDVSNKGITSLKGIENFTSLTSLNCSNNKLTNINLSNNTNLTSVTADNQAVETELKYEAGITKYKSAEGLFAAGTTFGASDVALDEATGAIAVDTYTTGKTSTFALPLSFGKSKVTGSLSGTVTFNVVSTKELVKAASVGDTVWLVNADGTTTAWIVLTKNNTQAELMTKEMVTTMKYANEGVTIYPKWSGSQVRTYLNSTYYNSLSQDVKDTIKEETSLKTPTVYNNFGSMETTSDKVYLLCQGGTSGSGTENVITPSGKDLTADTQLKEFLKCGTTAADKTTASYWWLRSPRNTGSIAGLVDRSIAGLTSGGVNTVYGVRPAMTLNLQ